MPFLSKEINNKDILGIIVALSSGFVSSIGFGLLAPLFSLRMDDYGLSAKTIGILVTIIGFAPLLLTPFVPKILNIIPAKKALLISLLINAFLYLNLIFIEAPYIWTLVRIGFAVTGTFLFVASESWILEITPAKYRGQVFGLYAVIFYGGIGLGGILIAYLGYKSDLTIIIAIILNFLIAPLFLIKVTEPSKPENPDGFWSVYKLILIVPAVFMPAFAIGGLETSAFNLFPIWIRKIGYDDQLAGLILGAAAFGNVILQWPIGVLGDRIGRKNVIAIISIIAFLGPIALYFSNSGMMVLIIVAIWSGFVTGFYTMGLVGVAENFEPQRIAAANAAFGTTYCLAQMLSPTLGGAMMDSFGTLYFMLSLSIIGLLPLIFNAIIKNTAKVS